MAIFPETEAIPLPKADERVGFEPPAQSPPSRPVNLRFLIVAVLVVSVLAGGVVWLHGYQMRRLSGAFLERADRHLADNDLPAAAAELRSYLALHPNDLDARLEFTLLLTRMATTPREKYQALLACEELLLKASERTDVRRAAVELSMQFGRYRDALVHLQWLQSQFPDEHQLRESEAACHAALGDYGKAAVLYRQLIQELPHRIDNYEALLTLLFDEMDRPDEAQDVANSMVAANDRDHRAYLARARFNREVRNFPQALLDAKRAYQLAPNDPDVLLLAADLYSVQERLSPGLASFDRRRLRSQLEEQLGDVERSPQLAQALAMLDLGAGRPDLAEQRLRMGLEQPDNPGLRVALVDALLLAGKLDEAQREIESLPELDVDANLAAYLGARLLVARQEWVKAARELESLRNEPSLKRLQADVNHQLGACYREFGQYERAAAALERAVEASPFLPEIRSDLADTLALLGRTDEALLHYNQILYRPGVAAKVARILLQEEGERTGDERDFSELDRALDLAAQNSQSAGDVFILRADKLMLAGRLDEARDLLQTAVERIPGHATLWAALAESTNRTDGHEAAFDVIERAEERLGERPVLTVARITVAATLEREKAKARLAALAEGSDSGTTHELVVQALAAAYEQLGLSEQSLAYWIELARRRPADLSVRRHLLDLALAAGDDDRARELVAEIREIDGGGPAYCLAEAARCLMRIRQGERSLLPRARQLLDAARAASPNSALISIGLADIAQLEGREEEAIEFLEDALERGSVGVARRLLELLYRRRQYYRAEQVVERLQKERASVLSGQLARTATAVLLKTRQTQRALELARGDVSPDSDNPLDQLWLAQVLETTGQIAEAEQSFRQAVAADPTNPASWIAFVSFLARNDRDDEAAEAIADARRHLEPTGDRLSVAQCLEVAGLRESAASEFTKALDAAPNDSAVVSAVSDFHLRNGRLAEAEALLERLVTGSDVEPQLRRAARRSLATLLVGRHGFRRYHQAMKLVDANLAEDPENVEDLQVKAQLLTTRSSRTLRLEAISILELLEERVVLNGADSLRLAELYESVGNWETARSTLIALLARESNDPDLIAAAVRMLLNHGEHSVTPWVQALAELQPDRLRTFELQARLHVVRDEADDALNLLTELVDGRTEDELSESQQRQLNELRRRVASILAGIAGSLERSGEALVAVRFANQAERYFRDYVDRRPEGILALVKFLGGRYRTEEALDVCARAWDVAPAESVALACVNLLRSGQPDPAQLERARGWLEAAAEREPESAGLAYHLANVAHLQEDYDAAIRWHRRAVQLAPESVEPYNELAFLLALKAGEGDEALEAIDRAIANGGPKSYLLDTRATVLLALDRPREAIENLETAINDSPRATRYFHLAQAHLAANNPASAKIAFGKAVAAGLHSGMLHALELDAYEKIRAQLSMNKISQKVN